MTARVLVHVTGRVQGVGFRDWVRHVAGGLGLAGWAANLRDGRVEILAEGRRADLEALIDALHGPDAPGAVGAVHEAWEDARGDLSGFGIR